MPEPQPTNRAIAAQLRSVQRDLRRRRRVRLAVRAVWLALLVWCLGLGLLLTGVDLPLPLLVGASVVVLCGGMMYAWFSQPSLHQLTHGLDRFYHLSEQTSTALEIARRGPANEIEQRLLNEAAAWLAGLCRYIGRIPLMPWREAETLLAVALAALGLTVALGPTLPAPPEVGALPDLPPPAVPTATPAPEPEDVPASDQSGTQLDPRAQAAADALADALDDNGATRSAADALRRGDLPGAARELRELADAAEQLSEQARREIAQGLREAADALRADQPGLADRLEQLADALEEGGQQAEAALEELARAAEQLGQSQEHAAQVPSEGEQASSTDSAQAEGGQPGAGAGEGTLPGSETRSTSPDTAQAQGEDLPLPESEWQNGPTTKASGPHGPSIDIDVGGTGTRSGSSTGGGRPNTPIEAAPDPLTIPLEYRDVVENYFTPAR